MGRHRVPRRHAHRRPRPGVPAHRQGSLVACSNATARAVVRRVGAVTETPVRRLRRRRPGHPADRSTGGDLAGFSPPHDHRARRERAARRCAGAPHVADWSAASTPSSSPAPAPELAPGRTAGDHRRRRRRRTGLRGRRRQAGRGRRRRRPRLRLEARWSHTLPAHSVRCSATWPRRPTARAGPRCSAAATSGRRSRRFDAAPGAADPRRARRPPSGAQSRSRSGSTGCAGTRCRRSTARRPTPGSTPCGGPTTAPSPSRSATGAPAPGCPSGRDNVVATYRVGIGLAADLRRERITIPLTRPLGLQDVVNPVRGRRRRRPRGRSTAARSNAPLAVRTLGRIVSLPTTPTSPAPSPASARPGPTSSGTASGSSCSSPWPAPTAPPSIPTSRRSPSTCARHRRRPPRHRARRDRRLPSPSVRGRPPGSSSTPDRRLRRRVAAADRAALRRPLLASTPATSPQPRTRWRGVRHPAGGARRRRRAARARSTTSGPSRDRAGRHRRLRPPAPARRRRRPPSCVTIDPLGIHLVEAVTVPAGHRRQQPGGERHDRRRGAVGAACRRRCAARDEEAGGVLRAARRGAGRPGRPRSPTTSTRSTTTGSSRPAPSGWCRYIGELVGTSGAAPARRRRRVLEPGPGGRHDCASGGARAPPRCSRTSPGPAPAGQRRAVEFFETLSTTQHVNHVRRGAPAPPAIRDADADGAGRRPVRHHRPHRRRADDGRRRTAGTTCPTSGCSSGRCRRTRSTGRPRRRSPNRPTAAGWSTRSGSTERWPGRWSSRRRSTTAPRRPTCPARCAAARCTTSSTQRRAAPSAPRQGAQWFDARRSRRGRVDRRTTPATELTARAARPALRRRPDRLGAADRQRGARRPGARPDRRVADPCRAPARGVVVATPSAATSAPGRTRAATPTRAAATPVDFQIGVSATDAPGGRAGGARRSARRSTPGTTCQAAQPGARSGGSW